MLVLNRAFTLFEVIIYVAIFSIVAYLIGGFAYNIYMGKDKIEVIQEINTNGRFMLDTITSAVEQSIMISGEVD